MTDSTLVTRWGLGVAAAAVVVLLVAVLLLLIIVAARAILGAAVRCLHAVEAIRTNVEPIWDLGTTNQVAEGISAGARNIEAKAQLLASTLDAHLPASTRSGS